MADKEPEPYHQRGGDTVRETAKWVAVALASVGAAIIAGIQLADLRNLTLPEMNANVRLGVAGLGIVLGLGGVGLAIKAIAAVLTPQHVTLDRLSTQADYAQERAFFATNKEFLRGFGDTIEKFKIEYERLQKEYLDARNADTAKSTAATQAALNLAAPPFKRIYDTLLELLRVASYEHLRQLFLKKLTCVFVFACIAAIGGTLFAAATAKSPQGDPASLVADRVTIELLPSFATTVQADLGAACDAKNLDAVVLSESDGTIEALVLPVNQCKLVRLSLPANTAKVRAKTMIDRKTAK